MTKTQRVICIAFSLTGCAAATLISYKLFEFGQEKSLWVPFAVGVIIVLQLMELVLERKGMR